jgi:16S rRNA (guanine966-N2)-methyltransferase
MSEKMRGALFNALGDIDDLMVLDAFAGSGALGFEAISRGGTSVVAVEADRAAQQTIRANIALLGIGPHVQLVCAAVGAWMRTNPGRLFDIVLCDPPYDDRQDATIMGLAAHVGAEGILVLSWPSELDAPVITPLEQIEQRSYGDAQLIFYRKEQPDG